MQPGLSLKPKRDLAQWTVLGLALLVGLFDIALGMSDAALFEVPVMAIAGYFGLMLARTTGAPELYRKGDNTVRERLLSYSLAGIALLISLWNAYDTISFFRSSTSSSPAWVPYVTSPATGILLSLRAGLTEELLFRLFVGTVIARLLQNVIASQKTILRLAMILTTIPFCLIVHPGSLIAYPMSFFLSVVYFQRGLLPAMLAHAVMAAGAIVISPIFGLI